ncbi:hypothetical protein CF65_02404 [Aggregatibacter actinomycetemcomitans HK1651]|nr:hypothetical protein CF65_02404 [Aggregatibacter actinomycetemcomitans HK1651]
MEKTHKFFTALSIKRKTHGQNQIQSNACRRHRLFRYVSDYRLFRVYHAHGRADRFLNGSRQNGRRAHHHRRAYFSRAATGDRLHLLPFLALGA